MESMPDIVFLISAFALMSLAPFVAVMATSFIKISVVLSLVRNAIGVQQIPPNMALNGLALILSLFIMAPVGYEIWEVVERRPINVDRRDEFQQTLSLAAKPYKAFLSKHTGDSQLEFFGEQAGTLWPASMREDATSDNLLVLIPAFAVTEMTKAFEIGFLLYLPFIAIDLIISNILLALGMMMVSPMTVSLPFKLLLFVLLDGWTKLIHGLVMSY